MFAKMPTSAYTIHMKCNTHTYHPFINVHHFLVCLRSLAVCPTSPNKMVELFRVSCPCTFHTAINHVIKKLSVGALCELCRHMAQETLPFQYFDNGNNRM